MVGGVKMFCPKCGTKVAKDAKFCPKCGQDLTAKNKQPVIKAKSSKGKSSISKKAPRHNKKLIMSLIAIAVVLIGYFGIYAPMTVRSVLANSEFTSKNDYKVKTNALKRTIEINAGTSRVGDIQGALNDDEFDTSKIAVEEQLSHLANSLSGRVIGNWKIQWKQHQYKENDTILWQFTGKEETKRYQNTKECRQIHQKILESEAQQRAQDTQNNNDSAAIAGGILGFGLF
ncbi:zinc-ribbon domain-containing protein [Lactobacillus halodurans]|uniref:Zinc-ribbon domain-containing protein n=2 Tax=Companilactobacillus halodurans TaxID=2584183 RepID=A0A5P0ZWN4_9LACO|nr:zinc-ribbon domain-containing protein [Companilactobacillus halodurans]